MQLASVRPVVERMHPPRALYCDFPLGRPLGKPGDAAYQHSVLDAAFALLARPAGPVLEDFPDRLEDAGDEPLACALPPRHDPSEEAAVDEARGLRAAYDRQLAASGRTNVGEAIDADGVPAAVAALLRVADGTPLTQAELPGSPRQLGLDIRSYYEEAALALADHVPAARQAEAWFFAETETGRLLLRAQAALRDAGEAEPVWRYMVPLSRQD